MTDFRRECRLPFPSHTERSSLSSQRSFGFSAFSHISSSSLLRHWHSRVARVLELCHLWIKNNYTVAAIINLCAFFMITDHRARKREGRVFFRDMRSSRHGIAGRMCNEEKSWWLLFLRSDNSLFNTYQISHEKQQNCTAIWTHLHAVWWECATTLLRDAVEQIALMPWRLKTSYNAFNSVILEKSWRGHNLKRQRDYQSTCSIIA